MAISVAYVGTRGQARMCSRPAMRYRGAFYASSAMPRVRSLPCGVAKQPQTTRPDWPTALREGGSAHGISDHPPAPLDAMAAAWLANWVGESDLLTL